MFGAMLYAMGLRVLLHYLYCIYAKTLILHIRTTRHCFNAVSFRKLRSVLVMEDKGGFVHARFEIYINSIKMRVMCCYAQYKNPNSAIPHRQLVSSK